MKQIKQPTPDQLKQWRNEESLTQIQAAHHARVSRRTWQNWESGDYDCPVAVWELLLLKTGKIKLDRIR